MFNSLKKFPLLISGGFVLLFIILLPHVLIFDGDTFYYIAKAKRILETGDFFNTGVLMTKPVLGLWAMALSYKIFGVNLFATYLWQVLFTAGILFFTYKTAREYLGIKVAEVSVWVLFTAFFFFYQTCSPMLDMAMLFFLAAANYFFLKYAVDKQAEDFYFGALFCGLNFLTKGVMGAALPFIILGLVWLFKRENPFKTYKHFIPTVLLGLIVCLLVVSTWLLPQISAHGPNFVKLLYRENIERFFHPIDETGGYRQVSSKTQIDPQVNLFYLLIAFLPWSAFIIPALMAVYKNKYYGKKTEVLFFLVWCLFVLLITSISGHYKGPRYLLPLFQPLAVLVALYLRSVLDTGKDPYAKWVNRTNLGLAVLFGLILVYLSLAQFQHGEAQYRPLVLPLVFGLFLQMALGYKFWRAKRYAETVNLLIVLALINFTVFLSLGGHYLRKLLPEYQAARFIQANNYDPEKLVLWKMKILSLDFYLNRNLKHISEDAELTALTPGKYLVATKKEFADLAQIRGTEVYSNAEWRIVLVR